MSAPGPVVKEEVCRHPRGCKCGLCDGSGEDFVMCAGTYSVPAIEPSGPPATGSFKRPVCVVYDGRLLLVDADGQVLAWVRPNDSSFEAGQLADKLAASLSR